MSSILTSQGMVLATAMAVSGTVIILAFRLQKSLPPNQFPINPIPQSPQPLPRSCIPTDGKKREKKKKKKKRVHFAEDVVEPSGNSEEFRRRLHSLNNNSNSESNYSTSSSNSSTTLKTGGKGMPANRVALYNGILRDRVLHRVAYSY